MKTLGREMDDYYRGIRSGAPVSQDPSAGSASSRIRVLERIKAFREDHSGMAACTLKARLHGIIAEEAHPKIFPHSPFFFELGMRPAENWGTPLSPEEFPASWLFRIFGSRMATPGLSLARAFGREAGEKGGPYLWNIWGGFDWDHHCLGYSRLLEEGVAGLQRRLRLRLAEETESSKRCELEAMLASTGAVISIAGRFAEAAEEAARNECDPVVLKNLRLISSAARHIPAQPPRTFYEGLAMLLFLREVTASLEAIGISVLGHPDRQLIALYRADLAAGRLTEAEARQFIAAWMLPHDIKTFARERDWPETSTCITLGGCDEAGEPVFNELTRLFIEVHREQRLLNPKLNCRYDGDSSQEYLELVSGLILEGHNHFALLNDDVLVESSVRMGKSREQARRYVNGGCQEPMCEGIEHTAGAYYYFNMAQVMHLGVTGRKDEYAHLKPEELAVLPEVIEAEDFESFYHSFLASLKQAIAVGAEWASESGKEAPQVNPCPLFSATLEGCIEKGMDYTAGGARFNPSGLSLVGLGDVVNSLMAVKKAVYEEAWLSLPELRAQIRADWPDETLRRRILMLPRYGHGDPETDRLAARFVDEIAAFVRSVPNERGESFQAGFFVYWFFKIMGDHTGATPDGRRNREVLCQGISPSRFRAPASLSDAFQTIRSIDFRAVPGNAVLDVQLPIGGSMTKENTAALIRTFARIGGPTLQLNAVNPEVLRQARLHPEEYRDLTVRISGLSAFFVNLLGGPVSRAPFWPV